MDFNPTEYGLHVSRVLALEGEGNRLQPLRCGSCSNAEAYKLLKAQSPADFFPGVKEPEAAMSGLFLYFSCLEEAHLLADSCNSENGYVWHGIVHRQEGDFGNAAYWFRKATKHPAYQVLGPEVVRILRPHPEVEFRASRWDPFAFLAFCDRVKSQPGTLQERVALEIQRAEWQVLFDYSARLR